MEARFSYKFYNITKDAWEAMYLAISGARRSVLWEIYGLADDEAGSRFIDILSAKAREGVEVIAVIDGIGSRDLSSQAEAKLNAAGVKLIWHNKLSFAWKNILNWQFIWHRNHRKLLIVDEFKVLVGGVNVLAKSVDWYDLHLQVEGVADTQMLVNSFARSYIRAGGPSRDVKKYLGNHSSLEKNKNLSNRVRFVVFSPVYNLRHPFYLRRLYWRALNNARVSFNLATPYFAPDNYFLGLIKKAVKRGVTVNFILPWHPDHRFMQWINHSFFSSISKLGGAIYFLKIMNHAKAFSADDTFGMVGSANLTPRSFFINHEICAYFDDLSMVRDLNKIFTFWKKEATPLSELNWNKRGRLRRLREWWIEKIKDYV